MTETTEPQAEKKVEFLGASPETVAMFFNNANQAFFMLQLFNYQGAADAMDGVHSSMHITDPTGYQKILADPTWDLKVRMLRAAAAYVAEFERVKTRIADLVAEGKISKEGAPL